jgi:hypothetical protein
MFLNLLLEIYCAKSHSAYISVPSCDLATLCTSLSVPRIVRNKDIEIWVQHVSERSDLFYKCLYLLSLLQLQQPIDHYFIEASIKFLPRVVYVCTCSDATDVRSVLIKNLPNPVLHVRSNRPGRLETRLMLLVCSESGVWVLGLSFKKLLLLIYIYIYIYIYILPTMLTDLTCK